MALAVSILAQGVRGEPTCGAGVEGYGTSEQAVKISKKLKRVGGRLAYVAMDEPLYFGRFFSGPTACHSPVANIVERVKQVVGVYRQAFPGLTVGDIEPAGAALLPGWPSDFRRWAKTFQTSIG